jgi:hypothetical protein
VFVIHDRESNKHEAGYRITAVRSHDEMDDVAPSNRDRGRDLTKDKG